MRERLVVDASAALAILRKEPNGERVHSVLTSPDIAELRVPDHFWLEVVNVLGPRVGHSAPEVAERVRELDELGLVTDSIDRPLVLLVLDGMRTHGLTAYDAAYLALAVALDADLVTLDVALATAAGERDVLGTRGRGRVSEEQRSYGSSDAVAAWAGFGSYLAKLRADALSEAR
jgi:predicted nucleic acid-binding protein